MLAACRRHGVTSVVTFHHFTSPLWLAKSGGWENAETPDRFVAFADTTAGALGESIDFACTINELNFSALLDEINFIPRPARRAFLRRASRAAGVRGFSCPPFGDAARSSENMLRAHRLAATAIKRRSPATQVGLTVSMTDAIALEGGEASRDAFRQVAEDRFILAGADDDFIGMQGYTRKLFRPTGAVEPPAGARMTQMGYEFWPDAPVAAALRAHQLLPGKTIIVTESGVATEDDSERIEYIASSLRSLARARAAGVNLHGYIHWSLMDNFEWTNGYEPKFGLFSVDRRSFVRTAKPSAAYLGALARSSGYEPLVY